MTARLIGTPQQTITYNRALGRYRDGATGKFVSRSSILRLVDSEAARLSTRIQGHARNLTAGRIDLPTFQKRMAEDLKLSLVRSALLGSGGKALATNQIYGTAGRLLRSQYEYLTNFASVIANGKLTKSQIIQRASLYGASTRSAFHQSEKIAKSKEGFRLAKRVLDTNKNHCDECLLYSTHNKFVPIDAIVPVGTRCSCQSRCRCSIIWKKN